MSQDKTSIPYGKTSHFDCDDLDSVDFPIWQFHMQKAEAKIEQLKNVGEISGEEAKSQLDQFEQKILGHLVDIHSKAGEFLRMEYETANPQLGKNETPKWVR